MSAMRPLSGLAGVASVALLMAGSAAAQLAPRGERAVLRALEKTQARIERRIVLWEDHSRWADAWRVQGEHYEVRTTASYSVGRDLAERADRLFADLTRLLDVEQPPRGHLALHIFPDLQRYNAFGDAHGAQHSSFYGSFYAPAGPEAPVAVLYSENASLRSTWALHSAVHQYIALAFPNSTLDTWLEEGLASYLAIRHSGTFDWARGEFARRSTENGAAFLSVQELVATPLENYGDRSAARLVELGMLFSYLLDYREDTRSEGAGRERTVGPFERLLRASVRGQSDGRDPVERFVLEAPDELEYAWRAFEGW